MGIEETENDERILTEIAQYMDNNDKRTIEKKGPDGKVLVRHCIND